jgi:hypothetical protein
MYVDERRLLAILDLHRTHVFDRQKRRRKLAIESINLAR